MGDGGTNDITRDDRALLTVQEVADYLRVPIATLYAWRHKCQGPAAFRVGRHLRYRVADVHRWVEQQASSVAGAR